MRDVPIPGKRNPVGRARWGGKKGGEGKTFPGEVTEKKKKERRT